MDPCADVVSGVAVGVADPAVAVALGGFGGVAVGQLDAHGVFVAVGGGGAVGVGHAPEPEIATLPLITEPVGIAWAAGEITTTSERLSGVSPPPQPSRVTCA